MPYYAPSAYYPLPGVPQAASQLPRPQQQQQNYSAPAQVDQVYLRQQAQAQAQAQQLAYQQQQQSQLQQQQYIEQQNRQIAQEQYYQQQQLQQQQYAAQQQRQQQQQYAQQTYTQQQQYQQQSAPSRQQQRSGYEPSPISQQSATPLYKSSEYVQAGGVYSTGGAYNQPTLRRVPSRADVNTAVENQEAPYQSFGQGLNTEQRGRVSQYNPYANYGQAVSQSPIRPASQREPSEYAYEGLNPNYKQQQQYSQGNLEIGARSLNAPTTVVLDANNNNAALPPRSPARNYSTPQRGYGSGGAQAESAYISIPNNLVYAQSDQQRAYNYAQESRPVYASSSRTNQATPSPLKLKPAAARELYAALSSENVRTALDRDSPVIVQTPAYSTFNGQRVTGRAFVVPADQKFSEYTLDDLNGLRSVIDAPLR